MNYWEILEQDFPSQGKAKGEDITIRRSLPPLYFTFVVKGCFRMYTTDDVGKEHNILFVAEGEWISDISSFQSAEPCESNIQALETSEVIQIEQQDLYFLYLNNLKLDRIFKVITENKYVEMQKRVLQNISSTAQQRYLYFREIPASGLPSSEHPNRILFGHNSRIPEHDPKGPGLQQVAKHKRNHYGLRKIKVKYSFYVPALSTPQRSCSFWISFCACT
jgi:hypothetical protein